MQFIPIEVQAECYIFPSDTEDSVDVDEDEYPMYHIPPRACTRDTTPEPPVWNHAPQPTFAYNPLHDLEALSWVGITFLASKQVAFYGKRPAHDINALRKQYGILRAVLSDAYTRNGIISWPRYFNNTIVANLHPLVVPLVRALDAFRVSLVKRYRKVEKDAESIGPEAPVDLGSRDIIVKEFNAEELMNPNDSIYVRGKKPRVGDFAGDPDSDDRESDGLTP